MLCIVFDEVHTAISWGLHSNGKKAFRKYFSQVGDLRAYFPNIQIMGLTATASKENRAKIKELLCMRDPCTIAKSPDRANITMNIEKVPAGVECLDWIVKK